MSPADSTPAGESEPESEIERSRQRLRRGHTSLLLTSGLPIVVAVMSLLFSFYIWYDGRRPPEVAMTLPDRVRVTQGSDQAWLYLQPRFVSTSSTERIEVIERIDITITPLGPENAGQEPAELTWDEQGQMTYSGETSTLSWDWVADPGPLVVSPGNPQQPTGLFYAPDGWRWQVGSYEIQVTAPTAVRQRVLDDSLQFSLTQEDLEQLESQPGDIFLTIRTEQGG